ncbi:hypothetical protein LEN26_004580 [Aphanomyces euteiches]|nr:hypothetical protein AeMF1_004923 [Aphanomyces euteiches]KAH9148174.1 hypothetical protein LEN26_004580 [Aphanomyces euteiches]
MGRTRGKGKAPSKRELELQVAAMREQLESISNTSSVASQAQDVVSMKHFATDHGTKRPPTLQNVHYSDRMVEILMELRYETFGSKFLQQTSICCIIEEQAVKLKKRVQPPAVAQSATGNNEFDPSEYPSYWDILVQYLGDKHGMGHILYADDGQLSEDDNKSESGCDSQTDENDEANRLSHKRKVQAEILRQRKNRKTNPSKSNDIVEAASLKAARAPSADLERTMYKTNNQLEEVSSLLKSHIEQSTKVQMELLNFLKEKF